LHLAFEVYHLDELLFPTLLFPRMHLPLECIVVSNLQQKINVGHFCLGLFAFIVVELEPYYWHPKSKF
jgi:hypothetical protein